MKKYLLSLFLITILPLAGCATLFPGLDPSTPIAAAVNPTIEFVTPLSAEPDPIVVAAATPAPTEALIALPTIPASIPLDVVPADQAGLEAWLVSAWREELPIPDVETSLDKAGWLMPSSLLSQGLVHRGVLAADMTGDNSPEWLLTLIVPGSSSHEPLIPEARAWPGNFYIVNGDGIIYRHYVDPTISADFTAAPWPVSINDFNRDGLPDILLDELGHNSQRYFGRYHFLTGADGVIADRSSAELKEVREQPSASVIPDSNPRAVQLRVWQRGGTDGSQGFYQLEQFVWQDDQLTRTNISIDAPTSLESLTSYLSSQWAQRVDSARVRADLLSWGWLHSDRQWLIADFDGDLRDDWAIVAKSPDPAYPADRPEHFGDVLIISASGVYLLRENLPSYHTTRLQHEISVVNDMTGDRLPDLLVEQRACNDEQTDCTSLWRVLSAQPGVIANLTRLTEAEQDAAVLARFSDRVATADSIAVANSAATIVDVDGDGIAELNIIGGISAENSSNRRTTQTWGWRTDEARFLLEQTRAEASPYRHHVLIDANTLSGPAADVGPPDLANARQLYEQTISNDGLLDDPALSDTLRNDIEQFAAFRLAYIAVIADDTATALQWLDYLEANHSGAPLTVAARAMQETAQVGSSPAAACLTARSILAGYENPIGALRELGSDNASVSISDLCATE